MRTTTIGPRGVEGELHEHGGVGLEVGEVVLLLEALIRAHLAPGAVAVETLGGDRVGHDDGLGQAAVDVVLHRCPLVVEHRGAGDAQGEGGDGYVVGAVAEGDVEVPAAPPTA